MSVDARLRALADQLGGDVAGDHIVIPGPGHSPKDRSLAVWIAGDDVSVHSFAGDDWRLCKDYARGLLGLGPHTASAAREARPEPRQARQSAKDDDDRWLGDRAREIYAGGVDWCGVAMAEGYLVSRGLGPEAEYYGKVLRFVARCPFKIDGVIEWHPTLVAPYTPINSSDDGPVMAIDRIRLDPVTGRKVGKTLAMGPRSGCAIKLVAAADVGVALGVGEGIETVMSIPYFAEAGPRLPIWALGGDGGLGAFPLLPELETLFVAVDNDLKGAGDRAAAVLRARYRRGGVNVRTLRPAKPGSDLNDVLVAMARRRRKASGQNRI